MEHTAHSESKMVAAQPRTDDGTFVLILSRHHRLTECLFWPYCLAGKNIFESHDFAKKPVRPPPQPDRSSSFSLIVPFPTVYPAPYSTAMASWATGVKYPVPPAIQKKFGPMLVQKCKSMFGT